MTLKQENEALKQVIKDIWWLARRYADGRRSYAVSLYNDAIETCLGLGMKFEPDPISGGIWAKDGDFTKEDDPHFIPGSGLATGHYRLPWGTRLDKKLAELLGTTSVEEAVEVIAKLKGGEVSG